MEKEFDHGGNLEYLLLDACYDEEDGDEKDCFDSSMAALWNLLKKAKDLPTIHVREVETESKQLKRQLEEKEKNLKMLEDKR